jgi:hypothetical protein
MENFLTTALVAGIIVAGALFLMAIGWLITGRSKMTRGCGMDPTKSRDEQCGTKTECDLCDHHKDKHEKQ